MSKYKNDYLLLLSPGFQGLPLNILENINNQNNLKDIILIYCNQKKMNRDLNYLDKKYKIVQKNKFNLFPNTQHYEYLISLKSR